MTPDLFRQLEAQTAGRLAFLDGVPLDKNPRRSSASRERWRVGWLAAQEEQQLKPGTRPEPSLEHCEVVQKLKDWARENLS